MQGLSLSKYAMRSTYFNISQGVFCVRSKDDPSFIPGDDISDESESENEDGFFTLTDTTEN